ncbi:unnamed protein product [Vitrella brassicaformis CCMP3155]|uniref:Uncharacterized protein n=1 Tax=Vitrella brassicaformis (strain CCMP3155) TaxID=1169540 RepID=A0A0G4GBJ1_VITBC|nr:unnamed protein product [Vitrella brassicaformis CCMP3155]|eukprot:CEM26048.1 unnamed protein product [Vitrella brassicaformis CCMP3155]
MLKDPAAIVLPSMSLVQLRQVLKDKRIKRLLASPPPPKAKAASKKRCRPDKGDDVGGVCDGEGEGAADGGKQQGPIAIKTIQEVLGCEIVLKAEYEKVPEVPLPASAAIMDPILAFLQDATTATTASPASTQQTTLPVATQAAVQQQPQPNKDADTLHTYDLVELTFSCEIGAGSGPLLLQRTLTVWAGFCLYSLHRAMLLALQYEVGGVR